MTNIEATRLPSRLLPQGPFWYVSRLWDWITEFGAYPARWTGLHLQRQGVARAVPYLPFALLIVVPLMTLQWPGPAEHVRLGILDAMPRPIAKAVLDPIISLVYLTAAFVLTLSLNREWSVNEKVRETNAALLEVGENDKLADLRNLGITTGLLLVLILPLWMRALNAVACTTSNGCLYGGADTLGAWLKYCLTAILPNGYFASNSVVELSALAAYPKYVLWPSLNAVLIFGLFELARIARVTELAVDSLARSPDRAVAVGRRILKLLAKIVRYDADETLGFEFYKNAAIAMGRMKSPSVIPTLKDLATYHGKVYVRNRAIQALQSLRQDLGPQSEYALEIEQFLRARLQAETSVAVQNSIKSALGIS
jgi:hypothetical protein